MKRFSILIFIVLVLSSSIFGVTIVGEVVDVEDGDTITVYVKGKGYYDVRLLGIDAPETKRNAKFKRDITKVYTGDEYNVFIRVPPQKLLDIGHEAKWTLRRLVMSKTVSVEIEGVDRYKNLGWVWLNGTLVNEYMVRQGLAKPYMLKGRYSYRIRSAEQQAKSSKIGIYAY